MGPKKNPSTTATAATADAPKIMTVMKGFAGKKRGKSLPPIPKQDQEKSYGGARPQSSGKKQSVIRNSMGETALAPPDGVMPATKDVRKFACDPFCAPECLMDKYLVKYLNHPAPHKVWEDAHEQEDMMVDSDDENMTYETAAARKRRSYALTLTEDPPTVVSVRIYSGDWLCPSEELFPKYLDGYMKGLPGSLLINRNSHGIPLSHELMTTQEPNQAPAHTLSEEESEEEDSEEDDEDISGETDEDSGLGESSDEAVDSSGDVDPEDDEEPEEEKEVELNSLQIPVEMVDEVREAREFKKHEEQLG